MLPVPCLSGIRLLEGLSVVHLERFLYFRLIGQKNYESISSLAKPVNLNLIIQ